MATRAPESVASPRWPYAMLTISTGLMIVTVAVMLELGSRWDRTFFVVLVPIEACLVALLISLAAKTLRPPTLRIDEAGITLRKGLKERHWKWRQIDAFYTIQLRVGSMVAFRWQADPGAPMRGVWLNYPFAEETSATLDRLTRALVAAHQAGASAPAPAMPLDPKAIVRWKRRENVSLAVLGAAFLSWLIDVNMARTALLTPIALPLLYGLELLGGALGTVVAVAFIGGQRADTARPSPTSALVTMAIVWAIVYGCVGAALGGYAAWRIGNVAAFAGSGAPIAIKHYRIVGFGHLKRGVYAEIDPYPAAGPTQLPISEDDFDRLIAAGRPDEASVYCYPVATQAARGAVRVLKPGSVGRHERRIVPCRALTDDRRWSRSRRTDRVRQAQPAGT